MKKRWIIRSFFIALLLLCVGAWVGSYWRWGGGSYSRGEYRWMLDIYGGSILYRGEHGLHQAIYGTPASYASEWRFGLVEANNNVPKRIYKQCSYRLIGFAYHEKFGKYERWLMVPLWFPTGITVAMLWFVWRKTKLKLIGPAFPIDPSAKPGKLKS